MGKLGTLGVLLIGLVGGWVISTAPGWLHASNYEHWWDIATAVGTIGATAASAGSIFYMIWKDRQEKKRIRAVILSVFEAPSDKIMAKLIEVANSMTCMLRAIDEYPECVYEVFSYHHGVLRNIQELNIQNLPVEQLLILRQSDQLALKNTQATLCEWKLEVERLSRIKPCEEFAPLLIKMRDVDRVALRLASLLTSVNKLIEADAAGFILKSEELKQLIAKLGQPH